LNVIKSLASLFTHREAWAKLGDLSKQEAMEKYLQLVDSLDPNWELQPTGSTGTVIFKVPGSL